MINIFLSALEVGYIITNGKGDIVYGELCVIERLKDIVLSLSVDTKAKLIVDSIERSKNIDSKIENHLNIIDVIIVNNLDIKVELKKSVKCYRDKTYIKNKYLKLNISCVLFGVMLGVLFGVPTTRDYFDSRQEIVADMNETILKIEDSATKTIPIETIYQELFYAYDIKDLELLEVQDNKIKCIFTSSDAGLNNIKMKSILDSQLEANIAKSDTDTVLYYYTLTGKLYKPR